jgi:chromate transporter
VDGYFWENLWDLFVAFLRASHFGFGGGPAIIPLVQAEAVHNYGWMSQAEFADMVAVSNALPGPIATKLAAYVGFQVASWPGAVVAVAATVLPTVLLLVWAGRVLMKYAQRPGVKSMLKGVRPVATALIAVVAVQWMMDIGAAGIAGQDMGLVAGSVVIGAGAAVGLYFKVHPVILIVAAMGLGGVMFS